MHVDDVRRILIEANRPMPARLLRLQGWRGADLRCALGAGAAMRLGPAACAVQATLGLAVPSAALYAVFAAAALLGVVARNHPVELAWVWWARRSGRPVPPANRAGRRFACALGAVCFALAGLGVSAQLPAVTLTMGLLMVLIPGFVAATNLCVPSLVLTLLVGAERVSSRRLASRSAVTHGAERPLLSQPGGDAVGELGVPLRP